MRITCPSCSAQYEVDENDISFAGQEVQCSECDTVWMQRRDGSVVETGADVETSADAETAPPLDEAHKPTADWAEINALASETNSDEGFSGAPTEGTHPEATAAAEVSGDIGAPSTDAAPADAAPVSYFEENAGQDGPASEYPDAGDEAEPVQIDEPFMGHSLDESEEPEEAEEAPTADVDEPFTGFSIEALEDTEIEDVATDDEIEDMVQAVETPSISGESTPETGPDAIGEASGADVDKPFTGFSIEALEDGAINGDEEPGGTPDVVEGLPDDAPLDFEGHVEASGLGAFGAPETPQIDTDTPPIQEPPVLISDAPLDSGAPEDTKPWELAEVSRQPAPVEEAETQQNVVTPFVKETPETEADDFLAAIKEATSEEVKLTLVPEPEDEPEFDEDALLETFRSQIEAEDALEAKPLADDEDADRIPQELIGRRARVPDLSGLKTSLAGSERRLSEEVEEAKPRKRFRRGFVLSMVLFTLLAAIYASSGLLVKMVPSLAPFLETYVVIVDVIRSVSAKIGHLVWGWISLGVDWILAKIYSA